MTDSIGVIITPGGFELFHSKYAGSIESSSVSVELFLACRGNLPNGNQLIIGLNPLLETTAAWQARM